MYVKRSLGPSVETGRTDHGEPRRDREDDSGTAAHAASACHGPVHLQLRWFEHERHDQRHQPRSAHHGPRRPDRDHPVLAGDGGTYDPRRQADRSMGPQALLHDGTFYLRGGRGAQRSRTRLGDLDPGELDPRRRGHGAPHSPRLHPHDHALPRPQVSGPGLRHHQRHGRDRRRHRSAYRRIYHHDHHLARCLRLSSCRRHPHRLPRSPHP